MPRLRLFGAAADAAGTRCDEVPGISVDEVLRSARERYGHEFSGMVEICRVWVNGEEIEPEKVLEDDDEVALLPPVSGG